MPPRRRTNPKSDRPISEPSPTAERRTRRPRLLAGLVLVLLLLVGGGFALGAFGAIPLALARRALADHDEDRAERQLAWAATLQADPVELALLRARLERHRGEFAAMNQHLQEAAAAGATRRRVEREQLLAAAQTGRLYEIEPQIKAWLAEPGDDAIEICEAYSNGLAMLGRLQDALVILDAWQADRPDDPAPLFRRGRIHEHQLDYVAAEKAYREALRRDPHHPPALYALARLLLDQKQPAEALPHFRTLVATGTAVAPVGQLGIAMSQRTLGNIAEARELLESLVQLDAATRDEAYRRVQQMPHGDPAALELGSLEADEGNYEVAERWLRQAVEADPKNLEARYAWAVALRGLKRLDDAEREFEYVSRVRKVLAETDALYDRLGEHPDDVEARYRLGMAYLQYRSEQAGLYWLQSVLNYDPRHQATHQALADYYQPRASQSKVYENLAEHHRQQADLADAPRP